MPKREMKCPWNKDNQNVGTQLVFCYSRSSLNGHSSKRTALLTAALFETPF